MIIPGDFSLGNFFYSSDYQALDRITSRPPFASKSNPAFPFSEIILIFALRSAPSERTFCPGGEMVDTRDLKSLGPKRPCGFDSRPGHEESQASLPGFFCCFRVAIGVWNPLFCNMLLFK